MDIIKIREHEEMISQAAQWFHEKWQVPCEEYEKSMEECIKGEEGVPQWYVAVENGIIIGGIGVIENDFHKRKDLAPNICALYVEEVYRCQGLAGRLLQLACSDMKSFGTDTLYLVTEHTSFYERYGWQFLFEVEEVSGDMIRMYVHKGEYEK